MQEPDAIYIQKPSRKRYFGFGLMTIASLGIVGGVWFYMMENVITNAASQARNKAQELNQIVEDYDGTENDRIEQGLSNIFEGLSEMVAPAVAPEPDSKPTQAALEAATQVIKENVIAETGVPATSDLPE